MIYLIYVFFGVCVFFIMFGVYKIGECDGAIKMINEYKDIIDKFKKESEKFKLEYDEFVRLSNLLMNLRNNENGK